MSVSRVSPTKGPPSGGPFLRIAESASELSRLLAQPAIQQRLLVAQAAGIRTIAAAGEKGRVAQRARAFAQHVAAGIGEAEAQVDARWVDGKRPAQSPFHPVRRSAAMGLFVCGGEAMGGRAGRCLAWAAEHLPDGGWAGGLPLRSGSAIDACERTSRQRAQWATGSRLPRKLSSSRWRWCCGTINLTLLPKSGRADQAARRKPAGTERQVEPTTGAQFQCQRSAPSALPLRSAHGGFILSGPRSSSALAFARAFEVPYQLRQFVIFSIEVGHR